jgi:hypothetical protein
MRTDLKTDSRKLEAELGMDKASLGSFPPTSISLPDPILIPESFNGKTAEALEPAFPPARVFVERVRVSLWCRKFSGGVSLKGAMNLYRRNRGIYAAS